MRTWLPRCLPILLCVAALGSPSSGLAADSATDRARQHYKEATKYYELGRWDEAIAEYEQAYSLRDDPSFLFNMAQTYRRKGDLKRALDLYRNYLIKDPQSQMRGEVEERIKMLKTQIDQADQQQAEAQKAGAAVPPPFVPGPPVVAPTVGAAANPAPTPEGTSVAAPGAAVPAATAPTASPAPIPAPAPAPVYPVQPGAPAAYPAAAPAPVQYSPVPGPQPATGYPPAAGTTTWSSPPPAPAPEATGSSGTALRVIGTLTVLGGVALLGASAYYSGRTLWYSNKVTNADTFNASDDAAGKSAKKLQYWYGGFGGGAVVIGVVLHAIGASQRDRASGIALVPQIDPHGAMLAASGAF